MSFVATLGGENRWIRREKRARVSVTITLYRLFGGIFSQQSLLGIRFFFLKDFQPRCLPRIAVEHFKVYVWVYFGESGCAVVQTLVPRGLWEWGSSPRSASLC